jgi:uncharacterized protein (DUF342 family)
MDTNTPITPQNQKAPENAVLPPVNAEANIIVSSDEQTAYLGIKPPANGGLDLTYNQLIAELEKKRVTNGVLTDALKGLAEKPIYNSMVLVAQGSLPVEGADAKLTFHFSYNREIKPRERSDGTVDYHDLGLIEHVTEGQKLVTLTPAVKGTPGKTVTGRVIVPAAVRNLALPLGKNTKTSDDKLELLAAKSGSVEFQLGKVNVYDVFTLNGNVSNATGNINFEGSVVVNGDVLTGFSVTATGNINVVGNVEGAVLEAGGDIKIVAGMVGQGRGRAKCGGNFRALFVENAEVFAKGDVMADVFMHSSIKCGGSLIADGKRGAIIGGNYIVGRDVKALTVGAPSGVVTSFELGIDPTVNERIKNINESVRIINIELVKLNQIIQLLVPLSNAGKLPPERAEMLEKAIATKGSRDAQLNELVEERESLTAASSMPVASQMICKRELFYGTKVLIGQVPYFVPSDLVHCRLYLNPAREVSMASI